MTYAALVVICAGLWLALTILITRPRSYCDEVDTPREEVTRALFSAPTAPHGNYGPRLRSVPNPSPLRVVPPSTRSGAPLAGLARPLASEGLAATAPKSSEARPSGMYSERVASRRGVASRGALGVRPYTLGLVKK